MARISTYANTPGNELDGEDKIIGTNAGQGGNATMNFTLDELGGFYSRSGSAEASIVFTFTVGEPYIDLPDTIEDGFVRYNKAIVDSSVAGETLDIIISTETNQGVDTSVFVDAILADVLVLNQAGSDRGAHYGFWDVAGAVPLIVADETIGYVISLTLHNAGATSNELPSGYLAITPIGQGVGTPVNITGVVVEDGVADNSFNVTVETTVGDFESNEFILDITAPVDSVNGQTGVVVLDKSDVGLGNVDNTSDLNKPISTATQTALDGKANTAHTHVIGDVTGLQDALNLKANLASPNFTGIPTVPLASDLDNSGQIASTAWVQEHLSAPGGGEDNQDIQVTAPLTGPLTPTSGDVIIGLDTSGTWAGISGGLTPAAVQALQTTDDTGFLSGDTQFPTLNQVQVGDDPFPFGNLTDVLVGDSQESIEFTGSDGNSIVVPIGQGGTVDENITGTDQTNAVEGGAIFDALADKVNLVNLDSASTYTPQRGDLVELGTLLLVAINDGSAISLTGNLLTDQVALRNNADLVELFELSATEGNGAAAFTITRPGLLDQQFTVALFEALPTFEDDDADPGTASVISTITFNDTGDQMTLTGRDGRVRTFTGSGEGSGTIADNVVLTADGSGGFAGSSITDDGDGLISISSIDANEPDVALRNETPIADGGVSLDGIIRFQGTSANSSLFDSAIISSGFDSQDNLTANRQGFFSIDIADGDLATSVGSNAKFEITSSGFSLRDNVVVDGTVTANNRVLSSVAPIGLTTALTGVTIDGVDYTIAGGGDVTILGDSRYDIATGDTEGFFRNEDGVEVAYRGLINQILDVFATSGGDITFRPTNPVQPGYFIIEGLTDASTLMPVGTYLVAKNTQGENARVVVIISQNQTENGAASGTALDTNTQRRAQVIDQSTDSGINVYAEADSAITGFVQIGTPDAGDLHRVGILTDVINISNRVESVVFQEESTRADFNVAFWGLSQLNPSTLAEVGFNTSDEAVDFVQLLAPASSAPSSVNVTTTVEVTFFTVTNGVQRFTAILAGSTVRRIGQNNVEIPIANLFPSGATDIPTPLGAFNDLSSYTISYSTTVRESDPINGPLIFRGFEFETLSDGTQIATSQAAPTLTSIIENISMTQDVSINSGRPWRQSSGAGTPASPNVTLIDFDPNTDSDAAAGLTSARDRFLNALGIDSTTGGSPIGNTTFTFGDNTVTIPTTAVIAVTGTDQISIAAGDNVSYFHFGGDAANNPTAGNDVFVREQLGNSVTFQAGSNMELDVNGDLVTILSTEADIETGDTLPIGANEDDLFVLQAIDTSTNPDSNPGLYYYTAAGEWDLITGATGGEPNQDAFSHVAVAGQTTVDADAVSDTLTLVAGTGIGITTDANTDSVTITNTDPNDHVDVTGVSNSTSDDETVEAASLTFEGTGVTSVVGDDSGNITVTISGSGGAGSVIIQDEGVALTGGGTTLDFTGEGVAASGSTGTKTINIPGLTVQEEGSSLTTTATTVNFTGTGVTATGDTTTKVVDIPGLAITNDGTTAPVAGNITAINFPDTDANNTRGFVRASTELAGAVDIIVPDDRALVLNNGEGAGGIAIGDVPHSNYINFQGSAIAGFGFNDIIDSTTVTINDTHVVITDGTVTSDRDNTIMLGDNLSFSGASDTVLTIEAVDTTYSDFTGATVSRAGVAGLVPAPPINGVGLFLQGDGSWGPQSGVPNYIGATDTLAGTAGLVPSAASAERLEFLRGDGTWAVPTDTDTDTHVAIQNQGSAIAAGEINTINFAGTAVTSVSDPDGNGAITITLTDTTSTGGSGLTGVGVNGTTGAATDVQTLTFTGGSGDATVNVTEATAGTATIEIISSDTDTHLGVTAPNSGGGADVTTDFDDDLAFSDQFEASDDRLGTVTVDLDTRSINPNVTYGSGGQIPVINVDDKGRITSISTISVTAPTSASVTGLTLRTRSAGTGAFNPAADPETTQSIILEAFWTVESGTFNGGEIDSPLFTGAADTIPASVDNPTSANPYESSAISLNFRSVREFTVNLLVTGQDGVQRSFASNTLSLSVTGGGGGTSAPEPQPPTFSAVANSTRGPLLDYGTITGDFTWELGDNGEYDVTAVPDPNPPSSASEDYSWNFIDTTSGGDIILGSGSSIRIDVEDDTAGGEHQLSITDIWTLADFAGTTASPAHTSGHTTNQFTGTLIKSLRIGTSSFRMDNLPTEAQLLDLSLWTTRVNGVTVDIPFHGTVSPLGRHVFDFTSTTPGPTGDGFSYIIYDADEPDLTAIIEDDVQGSLLGAGYPTTPAIVGGYKIYIFDIPTAPLVNFAYTLR